MTHSSCHDANCSHSESEHQRASESLYGYVDKANVRAFNTSAESLRGVLLPHNERFQTSVVCASDDCDDAAMICHVPFTASVKLKSFTVASASGDTAALRVRCFANRDDVDLANADEEVATQEFDLVLDAAAQADAEIPVKVAKWQRVQSITMHFDRSSGSNGIGLCYIGFRGEFDQKITRDAVIAVYESRAQLEDHATPATSTAREGI